MKMEMFEEEEKKKKPEVQVGDAIFYAAFNSSGIIIAPGHKNLAWFLRPE